MALTSSQKLQVNRLTTAIKVEWKKSVGSLIEVGRCLHELKKLLERKEFLEHLDKHFSMSEMHASRLEQLYTKFHDKKSIHVLGSKPSILYLLASTVDTKKIESLANGGKVLIENKYKTLSQFTVKDVYLLQEMANKSAKIQPEEIEEDDDELEDEERDQLRASTAHRRLATLVEELSDWSSDLIRFQQSNLKIQNKELVKQYIQESIQCLEKLNILLS
jgi:hypothetical protein